MLFNIDRSKMEKRMRNAGEDAPPVAKDGILIVCDGTGGSGLNKHTVNGQVHTSAYLGSRKVIEITENYLTDKYGEIIDSLHNTEQLADLVKNLGQALRDGLRQYVEDNGLYLEQRGKTFKMLPTTLTAAVYQAFEDHLEALVISAGDSRILFLDEEKGLRQLSVDDVESGYDAFYDNSNTKNCICEDDVFSLNYLVYDDLPKRGVLFATSDGFTDPIKPFDQEGYLIRWIGNCSSIINDFSPLSDNIGSSFDRMGFTGKDDCSIAGLIYGYNNDEEIKSSLKERFSYVTETFMKPYRDLDEKCKSSQDLYNKSGYEKKKLLSEFKAGIADSVKKNVFVLLPINRDAYPEIYSFLTSLPYINKVITDTEADINSKSMTLTTRFNEAESSLKSAFLDFYKSFCYISVKRGNCSFLEPDICKCLSDSSDYSSKMKECCDEYNNALQMLKNLPMIHAPYKSLPQKDVVFSLCDSLKTAVSVLVEINMQYSEANSVLSSYFSYDNAAIADLFEQQKMVSFVGFDKYIESIKPGLFSFIQHIKSDDTDYRLLKEKKDNLLSLLSIYRMTEEELKSDFSEDEFRLKKYSAVVNSQIDDIVAAVMNNEAALSFFAGDSKTLYESKVKSFENLLTETQSLIELKNELWKKYKTDYELFKTVQAYSIEIK